MSSEKRLFLFLALTFCSILATQYLMDLTGLIPPPKPPQKPNVVKAKQAEDLPPQAADKDKDKNATAVAGKEPEKPAAEARSEPPPKQIALAKPQELALGSVRDHSAKGYRMEVFLEQQGGGVAAVESSRFEAERDEQQKQRHRPLKLFGSTFRVPAPPALSMTLPVLGHPAAGGAPEAEPEPVKEQEKTADALAARTGILTRGEIPLDLVVWEVVRDEQGRATRPIPATAATPEAETGRAIVFRTTVGQPELVITKTYRLRKDSDSFELELKFESPAEERSLVYKLLGPHGIPIEGEWYTNTFRDVFFGQVDGSKVKIATVTADEVVKKKPEVFQTLPLKFAGVENQYFAAFVEPLPAAPSETWVKEAVATVIHKDAASPQKADVSVEITSKPFRVGPNVPAVHNYVVFAGPKTTQALTTPYGAEELTSKRSWVPYASEMATYVIAPMLDVMYKLTERVARLFGARTGNFGVAIILLTMTVRLLMFPIGRKQAMAAKKMQDLQPHLKELQEKFKDDKEQQTRETWALYKKHKVNPLGGCLPALIQLPIFVGLWQALNYSVHLRHAPFLYIENLAAPDMLFRFPLADGLPFLGQYFNLLPFLVVALMLVQTKLFSPPATTPEMEQQQKMMKYMMVFMAFMFYKVPSGLGIYFITSSLWQIGERLLLPKVTRSAPAVGAAGEGDAGGGGGGGGGGNGPGGGGGRRGGPGGGNGDPAKPPGKLSQLWERVLAEASKNPTHRNLAVAEEEHERDKDKDRDRDRGKPRARPGRRR